MFGGMNQNFGLEDLESLRYYVLSWNLIKYKAMSFSWL